MPETKIPIKIDDKKLEELGITHKKEFSKTEKLRCQYREIEWLEGLRQYKGIYDPEVLEKIKDNKSTVYPRYTRSKVQPLLAKLNNVLFPNNDKNWAIKPTPEPQLTKEEIALIVKDLEARAKEAAGEGVDLPRITVEQIDDAIMRQAKKSAEKANKKMDDQLTEDNFIVTSKDVIKTSVLLGTGVFKGPLSRKQETRKIVKKGGGYDQKVSTEFMPSVKSMSLWRFYPDMSSTELKHCNFVFELHSMTKHELRKLAKRKNFKSDIIKQYIRSHPGGDYKPRQWEIDLKALKEQENIHRTSKNYEVLERNGYVDGQDLQAIGALEEGDDVDKDWFVNMWLLGDKVIKVIKHPIESLTDLYHMFYFEKDESSIFGEGLPRIIRDTQISIASAVRAMLDNAAWVSGPITETNVDLLVDEDDDDMYPGRNLAREGTGADAQSPALRVYNIDSRIPDYISIISLFESIGDKESSLPAFLSGEAAKTTNETSKGISIRSSSINLTIHDIVKNYDHANESLLTALYKWNQEYDSGDDFKGDMEINAVGSASLVEKESRTDATNFFAQTLTPGDQPYIKRLGLLTERAKLLDLDVDAILHTEAEAQANIAAAIDSELIELEKLGKQAEIRYDKAKAFNMESKGKATLKNIGNDEINTIIAALEIMKGSSNEERG